MMLDGDRDITKCLSLCSSDTGGPCVPIKTQTSMGPYRISRHLTSKFDISWTSRGNDKRYH